MSSSTPAHTGKTSKTGFTSAKTPLFAHTEHFGENVAWSLTIICKSIPSHRRGPRTGDAHDFVKVEFERLYATPGDALLMPIKSPFVYVRCEQACHAVNIIGQVVCIVLRVSSDEVMLMISRDRT